MPPTNWDNLMEARIERAKACGWYAEPDLVLGYIVYSEDGEYNGVGATELQAWYDILGDIELWNEISARLEAN